MGVIYVDACFNPALSSGGCLRTVIPCRFPDIGVFLAYFLYSKKSGVLSKILAYIPGFILYVECRIFVASLASLRRCRSCRKCFGVRSGEYFV